MFRLFSKGTAKEQLSPARKKALRELCGRIGISINALSLLDRALTHSSAIEKTADHTETYERLEFLGDSILNASVAYLLYTDNPALNEGELSALRSSLVDEKTLSEIAVSIELLKYINLGKGETLTDPRAREKVTADIMESIIGVIFIEKGFNKALLYVQRMMGVHIRHRMLRGTRDYKTQLQKWAVSRYREYPAYNVVSETGPDHNKIFEIEVAVQKAKLFARASARTKKEAEQKAAEKVWNEVKRKGLDQN